jgi:uncharacterized protein
MRGGNLIEPRINVITLAVDDLERALAFYRAGLGFDSPGIVATDLRDPQTGAAGAIAVFNLQGGLMLCVYPRSDLSRDSGVPLGPPKSGEFSVGHAVAHRADVDAVLVRAKEAGATIIASPRERP